MGAIACRRCKDFSLELWWVPMHNEVSQFTAHESMLQNLTSLRCSRCCTNCCWSPRESLSLAWLAYRQNAWWPWIILETFLLCIGCPTRVAYHNKREIWHQSLALNCLKEDLAHEDLKLPLKKFRSECCRSSNKSLHAPSRAWGICKAHFVAWN